MALNGLLSGDVLLRNYSLTHSLTRTQNTDRSTQTVDTELRKKDAQLPQKNARRFTLLRVPPSVGRITDC